MFAGKKRQQISDKLCMILWGDHLVEWKAYPSRNTGRGLIILWRKDQDSGFLGEFDGKVVLIGFGSGLLAGVTLGSSFSH